MLIELPYQVSTNILVWHVKKKKEKKKGKKKEKKKKTETSVNWRGKLYKQTKDLKFTWLRFTRHWLQFTPCLSSLEENRNNKITKTNETYCTIVICKGLFWFFLPFHTCKRIHDEDQSHSLMKIDEMHEEKKKKRWSKDEKRYLVF